MTVIFEFPEAESLAAILRLSGVYSVIRKDIKSPELENSSMAIVTEENSSLIPKLKNEYDHLRVIYFGKNNSASVFSDLHIRTTEELIRAFPMPDSLVFLNGIALDINKKAAEISGKEIRLTSTEINVLRCLSMSERPLRAALLSELALGKSDARILMTHVSNINRKAREVFGIKIISSDKAYGYSITV